MGQLLIMVNVTFLSGIFEINLNHDKKEVFVLGTKVLFNYHSPKY